MAVTITDTGPLVAIVDRGDARHEACIGALHSVTLPFLVTQAVLTEAMHLLGRRVGWPGQGALVRMVREGAIEVVTFDDTMMDRVLTYMEKYRDVPMDMADATLVVLAEERNTRQVFTLDSHFRAYRFRERHVFDVVP